MLGVSVLRAIHVGDGLRQRPIVAQAAGQNERYVMLHAFVHDAAAQSPALYRPAYATAIVDGVDGAHMIAMAVLFLPPVALSNPKRSAEQGRFDIVHAQRISAQQRGNVAFAD